MKSKNLSLILAVLAALVFAFCGMAVLTVRAEDEIASGTEGTDTETDGTETEEIEPIQVEAGSFWQVSNGDLSTSIGEEGGLALAMPSGGYAVFSKNVSFENLSLKLSFSAPSFTQFSVTLSGVSVYDESKTVVITLKNNDGSLTVGLDNNEPIALENVETVEIAFAAATGKVTVNGNELPGKAEIFVAEYGKVRLQNNASEDFVAVTLTEVNGQSFQKAEDAEAIVDDTAPYILLSQNFNAAVVPVGLNNKFEYVLFDLVDDLTASNLKVTVEGEEISEEDYVLSAAELTSCKVLFKKKGAFTVRFALTDASGNTSSRDLAVRVGDADTAAPVFLENGLANYQEKLTALEKDAKISETVYFPLPPVTDDHTAVGALRYLIRYKTPSAYSWTTTSSFAVERPYITPSTAGTFLLQIIPIDASGNWADLQTCPTFTMTFRDITAPSVTFNITQNGETALYLGEEVSLSVSVSDTGDYGVYRKKLEYLGGDDGAEEIALENDAFTPEKTGTYRFTVWARDDQMNVTEESTTFTVSEKAEEESGSKFGTWLKNNYLAVIFLSVAVLCLAGIIVLEVIYRKKSKNSEN